MTNLHPTAEAVGARPRPARSDDGYSLVELLVVVAIIAIIAAIAVAMLFGARGAAEGKAAIATLRAISSAQVVSIATATRARPLAELVSDDILDRTFASDPVVRPGYTIEEYADAGAFQIHHATGRPASVTDPSIGSS